MLSALLAFLAGTITGGTIGVLLGAIIADTLTLRRTRRRRLTIDVGGGDALESWLAGIDWPARQPTNGTPFEEGDPV
jgi:hypothetical protein